MLTLFDTRVRQFTEEEKSLLTAFADQASLALEKARLLNDAEREKERSEALYRVSNLLAGAHDTDEVLDLIVNEAARLVGAPAAFIRLLEDDVLVPSAATQSAACYLDETGDLSPAIEVGERANLMGRTMAARNPVITEDALEEAPPQLKPLIQNTGFTVERSFRLLQMTSQSGFFSGTTTASAGSMKMKPPFSRLSLTRLRSPWKKPGY